MKNLVKSLISQFKKYEIDGYIIPKNDEFFSEHSNKDRLKAISGFTGSAGYAVILKKKITYLSMVDIQFKQKLNVEKDLT